MNCASIHRKIGTHVTKVKSLTLDSWTREQVEHMKQVGNANSNAMYNPDETRHPLPTNFIDSERDSELEKFIRNKYEFKRYMARSATAPLPTASRPAPAPAPLPPPVSLPSGPSVLSNSKSMDRSDVVASLLGPSRSASTRLAHGPSVRRETAPASSTLTASASSAATPSLPPRPAMPASVPAASSISAPVRAATQPPPLAQPSTLLQNPALSAAPRTIDATLPLQILAQPSTQPIAVPTAGSSPFLAPNPYAGLSVSPANPFPGMAAQTTGISPGGIARSMSLSSGLSAGAGMGVGGGLSPYQSSPLNPTVPLSSTPSPNPFAPQALPNTGISPSGYGSMGGGMGGMSGMGMGMGIVKMAAQPQPQPQTPYGMPASASSPFIPQQPLAMQSAPPMFQPQPQQLQLPVGGTPFVPSPSPGLGTPYMGPQLGGTPSPFAPAQALPQMQMQMQMQYMQQPMQPTMQQPVQQGFGTANPFTSWVQQPPGQQGGWGGAM